MRGFRVLGLFGLYLQGLVLYKILAWLFRQNLWADCRGNRSMYGRGSQHEKRGFEFKVLIFNVYIYIYVCMYKGWIVL